MSNRTLVFVMAASVAVICVVCLCMAGIAGVVGYRVTQTAGFKAALNEIIATATLTPVPNVKRDPFVSPGDFPSTETLLAQTDVPERDLRLLASRLKYGGRELPAVVNPVPPVLSVGDRRTFWVSDDSGPTPGQFETTARLQAITGHAYWWVEEGFNVTPEALNRSANVFETQTYPTNRSFFGSEWFPGVDNDVHLHIFLGNVPGVGGYYASLNEFSTEVNQYSNQGEMFFINLNAISPGSDYFDGVLAHEFQHMIHWNQDRNEETWVNEGLSELAAHLNGYDVGSAEQRYLNQPDLQLTAWGSSPGTSIPHYGNSYLFMVYFLEQFGDQTLKQVIASPANGIRGFNRGLAQAGQTVTFNQIFADFVVANYLDDPTLGDGRWGYRDLSLRQPGVSARHSRFPARAETTVHQYGVDYIEVDSRLPVTLHFTGSTTVQVVDNRAHSGRFQWYSHRGDDSDATLTRPVDLRGVETATLNYHVWFDIEEDWDYAYVEISADGGQSWRILAAPASRHTNPSGNAYGPGYTGQSNGWLPETVDLTPFAGQEVLLRFEYITDDALNAPGFTLDDVSIPEIGFFDDMESPDPAWEAQGFVRIDNRLRQRFTVQIIEPGTQATVTTLALDETNAGQLTVGPTEEGKFVVAVSAQAPVTTEAAGYAYLLVEEEE